MDQNQRNQFSLKLIQKCPVCNSNYQEGKIEILDETDLGFLAYFTCHVCTSSILVKVMTMPHGLIGNAILTDLSPHEVMQFKQQEDIASDNVLEFHQLVSSDKGFIERMRRV